MFKLDNDFLISLGLGALPVDEKNKLLQHIYETLEMRVGMRLAENMTDAQLDEFEGFIDRNDEPGALHWLETNFPNYKDVVSEELDKLKTEVTTNVPQILAAAQGGAGQAPAQSVPQPAPSIGQAPVGSSPQPYAAPQPLVTPEPLQPVQPWTPDSAAAPAMTSPPASDPYAAPITSSPQPQPLQPYQQDPAVTQTPSPATTPVEPQPLQPVQPWTPDPAPVQDPYTPPPAPQPFNPQPAPGFGSTPAGQDDNQQFTPPPPGFTPSV